MTELKVGSRLGSASCPVEIIVMRSPSTPVELCCGGVIQ